MEYLYEIIGVVLLATILKFFIPEGKIKPLVTWIISIIIAIVIVTPIFNLFTNTSSFNELFNDFEVAFQQDFIDYSFEKQKENDITYFAKEAKSIGIEQLNVTAEYTVDDNTLIYKKIQIDLKNAVINEDKSHIDIINDLTATVKKIFGNEATIEFIE